MIFNAVVISYCSVLAAALVPIIRAVVGVVGNLDGGAIYLPKLLAYAPEPVQHWSIKVVLWLAELMMQWGVLLITATVALMWLYRWLGRCWVSPWRWRLEQLGLFGYQRAMSAVWVTQMVALLLRHRLSLKDSLRRLQPLSNRYAGYHLQRMAKRLARGEQHLSQVMSTGLLTPNYCFDCTTVAAVEQLLTACGRPHCVVIKAFGGNYYDVNG